MKRTVTEVKPITYALQFRGHARPLAANLVRLELTAPSAALITTIGATGVRAHFDDVLGGEAVLRSETSFDEVSFDDRGTIAFGRDNTLRFRSIGSRLTHCPDPELRHGAVILRVEGGDGQFAGCEGLIASNFLISETGEVTENHAGVIFVAPAPTRSPTALMASSRERALTRNADRDWGRGAQRGLGDH